MKSYCVEVPVVPSGQTQLKESSLSKQDAPFLQGWLRHSFTSISQLLPGGKWTVH